MGLRARPQRQRRPQHGSHEAEIARAQVLVRLGLTPAVPGRGAGRGTPGWQQEPAHCWGMAHSHGSLRAGLNAACSPSTEHK